ncbi:hypothetical protein ACROYT_G024800 [Oculina patagonica]
MLVTSNGYELCEYARVRKCNEDFVTFVKSHPNDPVVEIYCNAYEQVAKCLISSSKCKGEFIDSHRYIILQQMFMDKKLDVCPQHDLEAFEEVVCADEKYLLHIGHLLSVDKDDFAPCAAKIHRKCSTQMTQEMENGITLCTSIRDLIKCYENPGEYCSARIYRDFVSLLRKFGLQIQKMNAEELPPLASDCENLI